MNETWKDLEGFEGIYQISNLGSVRSLDREITYTIKGKVLKRQYNTSTGEPYYCLSKDRQRIEFYPEDVK